MGERNAAVTLVEYGDYECPSCVAAHPVVKRVMKHHGEQVRFVFRNFPLEMHPMAEPAAEAAEYAAIEGKFWEMHDAIFERRGELSEEVVGGHGGDAGAGEGKGRGGNRRPELRRTH